MNYTSATEAVKLIKSGDNVYIQGASAIPDTLVVAMTARADSLRGVKIYTAFSIDKGVAPYAKVELKESFEVHSFFVSGNIREYIAEGHGNYHPALLGEIPVFFRNGLIKLDVALINVSPADAYGYCSLGASVDLAKAAVDTAKIIIAQVNHHQPRVFGDAMIHCSRFAQVIQADDPLTELPEMISSEQDQKIGRYVAQMIPDGATLQIGVGGIPNAVLSQLTSHRHLGLHTEALTEGVVKLIRSGVIDNSRKMVHRGFSVASLAIGRRELYDFMDDNPSLLMCDVAYTNDPWLIRQNPDVRAINSAIEVDITGQIVADSIGEKIFSGVGGQHDFMYGGALCPTGKTVIALPSATESGHSKIVSTLTAGAGVVTTRAQAQYIATEYGIAELRAKSLVERARALISIAHPSAREELERAAFARYGRSVL